MERIEEVEKIRNDFLNSDYSSIEKDVKDALAVLSPKEVLEKALVPSIKEVGELFDNEERFVPDLLISAEIMQKGLKILKPLLSKDKIEHKSGLVLIGTVEGDVHDIGKNLVISMLNGSGFVTIDLGVDVAPEKFVKEAKKNKPDVIAMSSLISLTIASMDNTIKLFEEKGIRDDFRFLVGGAVVSEKFASEIGADGYADNAFQAIAKTKELISEMKGVKE